MRKKIICIVAAVALLGGGYAAGQGAVIEGGLYEWGISLIDEVADRKFRRDLARGGRSGMHWRDGAIKGFDAGWSLGYYSALIEHGLMGDGEGVFADEKALAEQFEYQGMTLESWRWHDQYLLMQRKKWDK